jgi:hypothetical protein
MEAITVDDAFAAVQDLLDEVSRSGFPRTFPAPPG